MIKGYILQNWALVLVLLAFAISLFVTVFLDKKTIRRMYISIVAIFLLSICVYAEFYIAALNEYREVRIALMAIRYSATPFITAMVIYTLTKKVRWFIFIPAIILAILNIISTFTGIVFMVTEDYVFVRGPLGYLPFIVVGLYSVFLIYMLFIRSNKRVMEIVPIVFLALTLASGVIFPFVFGSDFSNIFCTTIGIALFAYYEFSLLSLAKKDSLTGLLNRQAYFSDVTHDRSSITALVSIDMNGLKVINDTLGHAAGDEALVTLALCFMRALRRRQSAYRIGGDEFIILCRRNTEEEVKELIERINKYINDTKYSCSIGYSYSSDGNLAIEDMLKESDKMMYNEKEKYYKDTGKDRRQR